MQRIQQIQLLGRNLKNDEHNMMWNQIESEIHLHRHKTVIRACRGRPGANNKTQLSTKLPPKEEISEDDDSASITRKKRGIGAARLIKMRREKHEGLGISITVRKIITFSPIVLFLLYNLLLIYIFNFNTMQL